MSVLIRKPGILTTVQDLGRFGSQRFGINPNGAMDTLAVRAINTAIGNDEGAAVLEMHFPAAEIEFQKDVMLGIAGADFGCELDGEPTPNWSTVHVRKGSVLKFTKKHLGNRAYLCVKGGFAVMPWLKSRSTNLVAHAGGFQGRPLAAGDVLECEETLAETHLTLGPSFANRYRSVPTLRIVASGEFELLTALSEQILLSKDFKLTNESNRMGFRLNGPQLYLVDDKSLVSSATGFGTIQLLPDGQLIILMADHQTTGGYPRVGNIISADLPIAGQLGAGDQVRFKIVSIIEAEKALMDLERDLRFFKTGVRLRQGAVI